MRDHTKLKAFQLADELAVLIYRATRAFPREEQFGLTAQLRRAAVSVASNIVEGCARRSEADYLHFLDIAFGSLREVEYQLSLAQRLAYVQPADFEPIQSQCVSTSKVLAALIRSLRQPRQTAKEPTA
jgi:four helix bundle protein